MYTYLRQALDEALARIYTLEDEVRRLKIQQLGGNNYLASNNDIYSGEGG